MAQFSLIFICLLVGYFFKRWRLVGLDAHKTLNAIILNITLPAMTLVYIPKIQIQTQLIFAIATPWINLFLAWIVFVLIGKKYGWDKSLIGAVIMMTGFGNTSFIGIPVIQALYGRAGLKTVMMVDQPGTFVALTTVGVIIANLYSNQSTFAFKTIFLNIIKFPPFIAFVIGWIMNSSQLYWSASWFDILMVFAQMLVPLALISVGMQWQLNMSYLNSPILWLSLLFKLLLFPLLVFIGLTVVFQQSGEIIEIIILESAMAPMITAGILASAYQLKPQYCNLMLGVGIPLSFFSLALWYLFLQWWF